ncbi:putative TonB system-dependent transport protein [Parvularcula bermudensis HTCC2503]|uniref:Putative TonB system-dependent transport protein n=1 Tax=Parvularcula bermudensis (strain ATCC BAA-594 / HTCC2503 / KCTC 12087) TaxID=314260 RepID=E0THR2_PARBH|nr:MotA/TolQ/ExbB proton channel family protein [Parvularcula bermudensis]ADM09358.1 putative TonB system-dependent transport protein [Parvularcula bermudensis HTCC2503]
MGADIFNPANALENLQAFLVAGGNVLVAIMIVTFIMWLLILERVLFFSVAGSRRRKEAEQDWEERGDHNSWYAFAIRDRAISEVMQTTTANFTVIRVLIAILPLLGLLGTVTGMVEVFDVMASTGSSNARLMAGGITRATIPTMAGLVASLSGILLMNFIERQAAYQVRMAQQNLVVG